MEDIEKRIHIIAEKYSDMIFRVAYSYTNNRQDAEDIVQDMFVKLIELDKPFESDEHEKAWIIRVTVNLCKNRLKLFWNKNTCALTEISDAAHFSNKEGFVLEAVMSLAENYRIIVYLYYYEGYKTAEIAKILKKRETSVRSALHRAREQLKTILKEDYDFEQ